jgi:hypothetical protein
LDKVTHSTTLNENEQEAWLSGRNKSTFVVVVDKLIVDFDDDDDDDGMESLTSTGQPATPEMTSISIPRNKD